MPVDGEGQEFLDNINRVLTSMGKQWLNARPANVDALPIFVPISQFKSNSAADNFIVGKSQETLEPVGLSLSIDGPLFMISSMTSGLGKTSALYLWVSQITQQISSQD